MRKILLGVMLAGCAAEDGAVLQIQNAVPPNASCEFDTGGNVYEASGTFDPGFSVFNQYVLHLLVRNNTGPTTEDTATGFGGRNFRNAPNDVVLTGFDACWYRPDVEGLTDINSNEDGLGVDCEKVDKAQRGFITSSALISENGGKAVTRVEVLSRHGLQAAGVYGTAFEPELVPLGDDPTDDGRDEAWGNYPFAYDSRVIVQVRAVGRLGSGGAVRSQWYAFPIDIQVGILAAAEARCCANSALPCGVRSVTCPDNTTGKAGVFLSAAGSSCGLPAQYFDTACTEINTCPAAATP